MMGDYIGENNGISRKTQDIDINMIHKLWQLRRAKVQYFNILILNRLFFPNKFLSLD